MSYPICGFDFSNLFESKNEKFKMDKSPLLFLEKSSFGLLFAEKLVTYSPLKGTQNGVPKSFPPCNLLFMFPLIFQDFC